MSLTRRRATGDREFKPRCVRTEPPCFKPAGAEHSTRHVNVGGSRTRHTSRPG